MTYKKNLKQESKDIQYDYIGDLPGPAQLHKEGVEDFLNGIQERIDTLKPHGDKRRECGSIIGYALVPINTVVSEISTMLHALQGKQFEKLEEN